MVDHAVREWHPFFFGQLAHQILFDFDRDRFRPVSPMRRLKPAHMRVDHDARGQPEGGSQHDIGGLSSDPGQRHQHSSCWRHLAAMFCHQSLAAGLDIAGLVAEEPGALDQPSPASPGVSPRPGPRPSDISRSNWPRYTDSRARRCTEPTEWSPPAAADWCFVEQQSAVRIRVVALATAATTLDACFRWSVLLVMKRPKPSRSKSWSTPSWTTIGCQSSTRHPVLRHRFSLCEYGNTSRDWRCF